ncbi:hypothetical protein LOC71_05105 [Rhodopirellula sp. JC740]|uniref:Uncharacterized protein n=1 Tax=Rhodopirellula halodulae TaxID=2894198 RepID=A0ABS8NDM9_9BACT|nr:hypothetical protein [Rhodopirellula sp. JC740]MCC9641643.1 hypothetical protein [Rhodopirellula sp. JC740]
MIPDFPAKNPPIVEPLVQQSVSASVRQFWKPNDYFHHNINIINDRLVIRRRGGDGASWLKIKFKTIRKARPVIHLAGFFCGLSVRD